MEPHRGFIFAHVSATELSLPPGQTSFLRTEKKKLAMQTLTCMLHPTSSGANRLAGNQSQSSRSDVVRGVWPVLSFPAVLPFLPFLPTPTRLVSKKSSPPRPALPSRSAGFAPILLRERHQPKIVLRPGTSWRVLAGFGGAENPAFPAFPINLREPS